MKFLPIFFVFLAMFVCAMSFYIYNFFRTVRLEEFRFYLDKRRMNYNMISMVVAYIGFVGLATCIVLRIFGYLK